jgi:alkylhydroperoxidase/carboxymuconolactone decarboxylase family protein YurZ
MVSRRAEPPRPQPCHAWHPHRATRHDELHFHVQIARNNGLTEDEIAEVIYHASGYAGFPAANTACKIAREVFDPES